MELRRARAVGGLLQECDGDGEEDEGYDGYDDEVEFREVPRFEYPDWNPKD